MSRAGSDNPFATLGLTTSASADEVRAARRELAATAHPDTGGDVDRMQRINAAADAALGAIAERETPRTEPPSAGSRSGSTARDAPGRDGSTDGELFDRVEDAVSGDGRQHDVPSFTIELLPVDAYEGLLLAAAELGEVAEDDPPYQLVVLGHDPSPHWVVLSLVPDAGASTVSLHVAQADDAPVPSIDRVRDRWIEVLNALDW